MSPVADEASCGNVGSCQAGFYSSRARGHQRRDRPYRHGGAILVRGLSARSPDVIDGPLSRSAQVRKIEPPPRGTSMNRQPASLGNLEQRVMDLIVEHQRLHPGQVTIDSTFANLGIDSFDWKELLPEFEEAFDVSIPNDIAKYARSVRDVVAMLRKAVASPMPVA